LKNLPARSPPPQNVNEKRSLLKKLKANTECGGLDLMENHKQKHFLPRGYGKYLDFSFDFFLHWFKEN
jgi:hypothetical protein